MQVEQTLRAAFASCNPPADFEDDVMRRVSAAAWRASHGPRRPGRVILFGAILVVAAAAAMHTFLRSRVPQPQSAVVASPALPVVSPVVEDVSAPPVTVVQEEPRAGEAAVPRSAAPPVKVFTVRVLALENAATEANARSAVDRFFQTMLDELRAVPGLTLVEPDSLATAPEATLTYELQLRGRQVGDEPKYQVSMEVLTIDPDQKVADERLRPRMSTSIGGDIAPVCAGGARDDLTCTDPADVAAFQIRLLRTKVFPPDASLRQELQAELVNPAADQRRRINALTDLASWRTTLADGRAMTSGSSVLRDPEVLRAAIDLAARAVDPAQRMQVWRILRRVDAPDLRQGLIAASHEERDTDVRAEIATSLAQDRSGDPEVRAALERIAREDTRPLVRAIAQRAISGEASWQQYMRSTLLDTTKSAVERAEAVFHDMNVPLVSMPAGYGVSRSPTALGSLGDEGLAALAEVLPRAARESQAIRNGALPVVQALGSIEHPAITRMLLDEVEGDGRGIDRHFAASQLARRIGDPEVRATLENLSVTDSDPQMRETAAAVLKAGAAP